MKNDNSIIDHILRHLLMKNDEYTPKNGDFYRKTMKAYSKVVILSLKKYENILKYSTYSIF